MVSKIKVLLMIAVVAVSGGAIYLSQVRESQLANAKESKDEIIIPLNNNSEDGLGIKKYQDTTIFPNAIAISNEDLYVSDPVNERIVEMNKEGNISKIFKIKNSSALDIAANNDGALYLADYKNNMVQIYDTKNKSLKSVGDFNLPHMVKVINEKYYIVDFKPGTFDLRIQCFDKNNKKIYEKTQSFFDINLFKVWNEKNTEIEITTDKPSKDDLAGEYQIINKQANKKYSYIPNLPPSGSFRDLSVLSFSNNKLLILRKIGPKFDSKLSIDDIQNSMELFLDSIDVSNGQVETTALKKDLTLLGTGLANGNRFVINQKGELYQSQISQDKVSISKYNLSGGD